MTVKKTARTSAEISMTRLTVVDFTIFRLQLELCFAASFFFYLNIVLINYSPQYSVSPDTKEAMK